MLKKLLKLELAAALSAAVILFNILIMKPIVGVADNGDFYRIMAAAGLEYLSEDPADRYFGYVNREYRIKDAPPPYISYFTTGILLAKLAISVNSLLSAEKGIFDIRFLSFIYICILVVSIYFIIKACRQGLLLPDAALCILLVFIFTDIGYISYFNSLYGEAVSLTFLFLAAAAALHIVGKGKAKMPAFVCFFLASMFLAGAKAQNAPIGIILALFGIRLMSLRKDVLWKTTGAAFSVLLVAISTVSYVFIPEEIKMCNRYQAVFYGILKDSPNPEKDLEELGIRQDLAVLAGTDYFMKEYPVNIKDPSFRKEIKSKVTPAKVGLFYIKHPERYLQKLKVTAKNGFTLMHGYGNYEKAENVKYGQTAASFNAWSLFKKERLPHSLTFILIIYAAYFAVLSAQRILKRNTEEKLYLEIFMLIGIIGAVQFIIPVLGDGEADLGKHLFLFNACFDMMLVTSAVWIIHWAVRLKKRLEIHSSIQKL